MAPITDLASLSKTRHRARILFSCACALGSLLYARDVASQSNDPFNRKIAGFQLKNETVLDAMDKIAAQTELSMSVELTLRPKLTDREPDYPRFSQLVPPARLSDSLDLLCAMDRRFAWTRYKDTINIYPRPSAAAGESYFMNRKLPRVVLKQEFDPAQAVFQAINQLPGKKEQIAFMQAGGSPGFSSPWNVDFKGISVREFLDEVAQNLGKGYGWTLSGSEEFRVIRFHPHFPSFANTLQPK